MTTALTIANYIANRYKNEYGVPIDEMKLHKLLYFSQREAFIQLNQPLFKETFYAWKYGPVLIEVREKILSQGIESFKCDASLPKNLEPILDKVFLQYACKSSWSLSRLSHGEASWQNARKDLNSNAPYGSALTIEDIKTDAQRIKLRRTMLSELRGN